MAIFLPTSIFGNATASAVESILGEIFVLLVFFLTWTFTSSFRHRLLGGKGGEEVSAKGASEPLKSKWRKDPAEAAQLIQDLCKDHFTRALRLYRELVKHDLDKGVTRESFYLALVEGSVRVGKPDIALQVMERMKDNSIEASTSLLQSVFRLLCARKYYTEVLRIAETVQLPQDPVITSCLTLAAGEVGQLDVCEQLLAKAKAPRYEDKETAASKEYLPLMRAYAKRKDWASAVRTVRELMERGALVENVLFNSVLNSCGGSDPAAMHALLNEMYAYDTKAIDIVSFNTLMKSYARAKDVKQCFGVLTEVQQKGLAPDDVTFSTLLDVCIDANEHELANKALEQLCASGLTMNCVLLTTLMKGFIRVKRLDLAMNLYEQMRSSDSSAPPDMVTYSQLIKAHADAQQMDQALDILEDMLECGCRVDDVVFTHLIEGCCHISNYQLAEKLFRDMRAAAIRPTIYALTALIKVYGKCGQSQKAKELLDSMEDLYGVKPTVVVYTCLISGLLRQKKTRPAYAAYRKMEETLTPDAQCVTTMVNGLAEDKMWDEMLSVVQRSPVAKPPPRYVDVLNNALNGMLTRGDVQRARVLHKLMVDRDLKVTVQSILRRLNAR